MNDFSSQKSPTNNPFMKPKAKVLKDQNKDFVLDNETMFLAPDKTPLTKALSKEKLQYLYAEEINEAWQAARRLEIKKPAAHLANTRTQAHYDKIIAMLSRRDEDGNPFRSYENSVDPDPTMLTRDPSSNVDKDSEAPRYLSKSTQTQYLAACKRYAADIVNRCAPMALVMMAKDEYRFAIAAKFKSLDSKLDIPDPKSNRARYQEFAKNDLSLLAEAILFLSKYPINVLSQAEHMKKMSQAKADYELRKKAEMLEEDGTKKKRALRSKRNVLSELNAIEGRKKSKSMTWRDGMFQAAMKLSAKSEAKIDRNFEKAVMISILSLCGPRPDELCSGVQIHALCEEASGEPKRLLFRIEGSKVTTPDYDKIAFSKLTIQEKKLLEELKSDETEQEYQTRGQIYKWLEIEVDEEAIPETAWLWMWVASQSDNAPLQLDLEIEDEAELSKVAKYQSSIEHSYTYYPENIEKHGLDMDNPNDRLKVVDHIGKNVGYIAEKAGIKTKDKITAYTFRHALASDLKTMIPEEGSEEITSEALGHASNTTRRMYGSSYKQKGRPKKSSRGRLVKSTITSRIVRNKATSPAAKFGKSTGNKGNTTGSSPTLLN